MEPCHSFTTSSPSPAANPSRPGRLAWLLLTGSALAALAQPMPAFAQVVIDNGDTETVKGDDTGTQPSPWDTGSTLLVGETGTGTLAISDGGIVESEFSHVGFNAGADGTVTVDGSGSAWHLINNPYIGSYGTGHLAISNGGLVSNTIGTIGFHAGSNGTATVDGAGSQWTNVGLLRVGYFGNGSLTIANGGTVSALAVTVAQQAGSVGTVNIGAAAGDAASGAGTLDAPTLTFGAGSGRLVFNHTDAGYVFATSVEGTGALDHYAGETVLTGQNGYTGSTNLHGGTLVVSGGGTIAGTYEMLIAADPGDDASLIVSGANGGGAVYLEGDFDDFDIDNGTGPGYLYVGVRGSGSLAITDGGSVNDLYAYVGTGVGSDGTVTVDGEGSTWTNRGDLHVGWRGTGDVQITGGGTVTNGGDTTIGSDALGTITIDGAGSSLASGAILFVGDYEEGRLAITNGGSASAFAGVIGYGDESLGIVTVAGAGSRLALADMLYVGFEGSGSLAISDGGAVDSLFGYVGYLPGVDGTVSIDGAGSAWTLGDNLFLGQGGAAELAITNGGSISNDVGYVAMDAGSSATITVDGSGSTWSNAVALVLGSRGNASLAVTDGGSLATTYATLGIVGGGTGAVTIDGAGSAWTASDETIVGLSGTGSLTLANGGRFSGVALMLAQEATAVGTVAIGGAAGDAASGAGTLDVPTLTFGTGTGTLVFNHSESEHAFAPALAGDGAVLHLAGHTRLAANSSGFAGTVDVTGGTLDMGGTIGGTVNVSGSGMLVGTGTVADLAIGEGGLVAPGNSIGTLNVSGNLTFNAGSVFAVEVDPSGSTSDLIAVSGTATLQGGTVAHVGPDGDYSPSSTYTILAAAGGVTGQFDGATSDFAFLSPVLDYLPNAVTLTLRRNGIAFGDVARTYNQQQVGGVVEDLGYGNPLVEAILVLGEDDARMAFDSLSGEVHASVRTALGEDLRLVRHTVMDRMVRQADAPSLWAELIGNWSTFDESEGTARVDQDLFGIAGGAQFALGEGIVAGIATAYTDSNVELDRRLSSADLQSIHLMAYLGLSTPAVNLKAGAGYSHSAIDTRRDVSFGGFDERLAASYDGEALQAFAELGHAIALAGGSIEPFGRFTLARLDTEGFTETGGDAALSGANHARTTAGSLLGAHFATAREQRLRFEGTLAWQHAFSGYRSSADLIFGGGLPFGIVGASSSRDAGVIDLSAVMGISASVEASVTYHGMIGNSGDGHAVTVGFALRF